MMATPPPSDQDEGVWQARAKAFLVEHTELVSRIVNELVTNGRSEYSTGNSSGRGSSFTIDFEIRRGPLPLRSHYHARTPHGTIAGSSGSEWRLLSETDLAQPYSSHDLYVATRLAQMGRTLGQTKPGKPANNSRCYCGSGKKYKQCHGAGSHSGAEQSQSV